MNVEKRPFDWVLVEPTGDEKPSPRAYHAAALFISNVTTFTVVVFGGRPLDKSALNDTWGLRRHKDGRWDWVKAPYKKSIVKPTSRYHHSLFFFGTLMFVYGGRNSDLNKSIDLDVYDTDTSLWTKHNCDTQRFRHGLWITDTALFVFGGFEK